MKTFRYIILGIIALVILVPVAALIDFTINDANYDPIREKDIAFWNRLQELSDEPIFLADLVKGNWNYFCVINGDGDSRHWAAEYSQVDTTNYRGMFIPKTGRDMRSHSDHPVLILISDIDQSADYFIFGQHHLRLQNKKYGCMDKKDAMLIRRKVGELSAEPAEHYEIFRQDEGNS